MNEQTKFCVDNNDGVLEITVMGCSIRVAEILAEGMLEVASRNEQMGEAIAASCRVFLERVKYSSTSNDKG